MNILSYDSGEMRKGRLRDESSRTSDNSTVKLSISQDSRAMNIAIGTEPIQMILDQAGAKRVITHIRDGRIYIKPCNQDGYAISYNMAKSGGLTKRCTVRIPLSKEEAEELKAFQGEYLLQRATSGTKDLYFDLRQRLPF